jgi:hypothetical protein
LWIVFTHAIDVVSIAAILALTSPEKRCGKTTLLALLRRLARPAPAVCEHHRPVLVPCDRGVVADIADR